MSVSSVSDDERLLEEESPVERKAGGNRKPQPQQDTSHITTHKALEYALYLCRVHKHTPDVKIERKAENNELVLLDESVTRNFEDHVQNLCAKTPAQGGVNIRLVLMNPEGGTFLGDKGQILELFQKHWGIDMGDFALLTTQPVASYHSRVVDVHGDMCLDISYNIREDILYDQDNISSLESSLTVNVIKSTNIHIEREYEPVYFRHNISTGQTTYILPNASREQRYLLHNIDQKLSERGGQMHPFTLHAVILFQSLAARSATIDNMLRRLLWIETQIYQGSIFQGTESEKFIQYIQLSHKLSRNLITLEHRNQKDTCLIEKLLGDHKRWWRLTRQCSMSSHSTDIRAHEHVRESLLSLKDSAHDQHRQILSAERKTQLFITLLYNLITGHDSGINLQIASETAKVAHEAKKDSTSMKIIAGVTMFYLPATFVCSLFGTNFVALNTNTSEPTFIVSKLWWVYIAFAVPLTLATIMGFHVWRRWRRGPILVNRMDNV